MTRVVDRAAAGEQHRGRGERSHLHKVAIATGVPQFPPGTARLCHFARARLKMVAAMAEAALLQAPSRARRRPRLPAETVLRAARRVFMSTGTLEMRALARELGIGRATLYRWRGGRMALLSEVIASLGVANLRRAESETVLAPGPERLCRIHALHLERISASPAMQAFLRSEPETASQVLLDAGGRVHRDVTAALADLIEREAASSGWKPPLEPPHLASAVSRLSEAFLYSELIAHDRSDVATPDLVLRMMLGLSLNGEGPAGRRRRRSRG